jgi:hypothetical protein
MHDVRVVPVLHSATRLGSIRGIISHIYTERDGTQGGRRARGRKGKERKGKERKDRE